MSNLMAQTDTIKGQPTVDVNNTVIEPADSDKAKDNKPFVMPDVMPEFPGGQGALMMFLVKAPYPVGTKASGEVKVQFVIGIDGAVSDFKVVESANDKILDDAALNYLVNMPQWKPAYKQGEPMSIAYVVPVKYRWK